MRMFSQIHTSVVKSTKSQQHRHGSHKIQVHTNKYPQIPTFCLVPCPTLRNTISTHFTPDEIQRIASNTFSNKINPLREQISFRTSKIHLYSVVSKIIGKADVATTHHGVANDEEVCSLCVLQAERTSCFGRSPSSLFQQAIPWLQRKMSCLS